MAPVQIPQETARVGLPSTRPSASSALWFLRLSVQLLQVFVSLFILHRLWVISFPQPLLLVQLLLQPLLPAQFLQWQPLEVSVILHVSLTQPSSTKECKEQTRPSSCAC